MGIFETKLNLLSTPIWSLKDLMLYMNVKSKTTGIQIKERAFKEYNGKVPYGSKYVKRDSILALCGTTVEQELRLVNETLQKGKI